MENVSNTTDRQMRITGVLCAPLEFVWDAWTKPDHIAHWWGPAGFTSTIHKMDVTPNGEWLLTMFGPDGKRFPTKSTFIEIVPIEKIVFHHFNPNYLATVLFEPKGNETFMEWTMVFETAELFNIVVNTFKADEGLSQNVEKLEKYLEEKLNR